MLVFSDKFKYKDPLNIVFLCGSHYDRKNSRDKRKILKGHIGSSVPNVHAIILEENFQFTSTNKHYLSYDTIYLTGLAQVEQLASLFASKIIIIHETTSTAAELGMFAIDPLLANKICLLVPDSISVEEDKISGFIRLAFFKKEAPETKVHIIRFYPDVEIHRTSPNKSDYYTFFHNDIIGKFLGKDIEEFLADGSLERTIHFKKNRFQKVSTDSSIVDYTVSEKDKSIAISTHIDALKIHLLSMLGVDFIRKELREEKDLRKHVNYMYTIYREIICNTVENITGIDCTNFKVSASLKGTNCNIKQAIGYFIYMLQAANLISLVQKETSIPTIRRVQFSTALDKYEASVHGAVLEIGTTEFGRLVT